MDNVTCSVNTLKLNVQVSKNDWKIQGISIRRFTNTDTLKMTPYQFVPPLVIIYIPVQNRLVECQFSCVAFYSVSHAKYQHVFSQHLLAFELMWMWHSSKMYHPKASPLTNIKVK